MDKSEQSKSTKSTRSFSESVYEDEINLRDLIGVLWNWRKLILAIFLVSLLIGAVYSFAATPVYQVQAKVSLGNYLDKTASRPLVSPEEAKEILSGSGFLEEALNGVPSKVQGLQVTPVTGTNIIKISCETNNPKQGEVLLNKITGCFTDQVSVEFEQQQNLMKSELKRIEADITEVNDNIKLNRELLSSFAKAEPPSAVEVQQEARLLDTLVSFSNQREVLMQKKLELEQKLKSNQGVQIIEKPAASSSPVRPRKKLNIALAGVIGLMIGIFAAFTVDYFKRNPLKTN